MSARYSCRWGRSRPLHPPSWIRSTIASSQAVSSNSYSADSVGRGSWIICTPDVLAQCERQEIVDLPLRAGNFPPRSVRSTMVLVAAGDVRHQFDDGVMGQDERHGFAFFAVL